MKKIITLFILISALIFYLSSCSLVTTVKNKINNEKEQQEEIVKETPENSENTDDGYLAVPPENEEEKALVEQGFEKVEKRSAERTIEELLQALRDGEPMTDSSGAEYSVMPQTYSVDLTEMAALQGSTVEYSEESWETEKTVEEFDMELLTAEMTPEEKAEWDEIMSMTEEDWERMISEMEAEIEEMRKSFSEDSLGDDTSFEYPAYSDLEDLENIELPDMEDIQKQIDDAMQNLPEGFESLFPEGFDISSILG